MLESNEISVGASQLTINDEQHLFFENIYKEELPKKYRKLDECPRSLQMLNRTDTVTIQSDLTDDYLLGFDSDYRYEILDGFGERIYMAGKRSNYRCKHCMWRSNNYQIVIFDSEGEYVFDIKCEASCCEDVIQVFADGDLLGKLYSRCKLHPIVEMRDNGAEENSKNVMTVEMTNCHLCGCYSGPASFDIYLSQSKQTIGKIDPFSIKQTDLPREGEHYCVIFRKDLSVGLKVMLVAALFHVGTRYLTTRCTTLARRMHADNVNRDYKDHSDTLIEIEKAVGGNAEAGREVKVDDSQHEKISQEPEEEPESRKQSSTVVVPQTQHHIYVDKESIVEDEEDPEEKHRNSKHKSHKKEHKHKKHKRKKS